MNTDLAPMIYGPDGEPKNSLAREAGELASLRGDGTQSRALNLCGQNPNGTFSEGNTCAAGGDGAATVADADRPTPSDGPTGSRYDTATLAAAGPPSQYEGADLVNGQVLWDRYSIPSDTYMKDAEDASLSPDVAALLKDYSDAGDKARAAAAEAFPLRRQAAELAAVGAAALGISEDRARSLARMKHGDPRPEKHSLAWAAEQFSSSVANPLLIEMSRTRPRTAEQEANFERIKKTVKSVDGEENMPTQADVESLVSAARRTKLPEGITLWHGWEIGSNAEREKLDALSSGRAEFTNDTLLSTTIRPALAAHFGKTDSYSEMRKAKSSHRIAPDGSMSTVIRIRGQKTGLPIAGSSHYTHEAEVTLPPSRFRFTGKKTIVFMPMANDTGWPSTTFRTDDMKWDSTDRVLFPVAVYDVEPVENGGNP